MALVNFDSLRLEQGNRAPWLALPALGLLVDEKLFGPDHLSKRLALNLATVQQIKTLRASDLRARARRRYQNPTRQAEMTDAVAAVEACRDAIQRGVEGTLDLAKALVVGRPPKDEPEEDETPTTPEPSPEPNPIEPPSWAGESSDALLEGRDEDLAAIADAIDEAWTAFEEAPSDDIEIPVTLPSNQREVTGTTAVNRKVLDWVQAFCSQENWGGFLDTSETFLPVALASTADRSPVFIRPDRVVTIEGEELSLEALLTAWDEDLPELIGHHTRATWREFQAVRAGLLPHLGKLIYHARSWLDGWPEILAQVRRYDGAHALHQALDQYIILHPNHPYPLRVALINPPQPENLMMELVRLLNDPRYRGGQKLAAVDAAVYATGQHTDRLRAALSFTDTHKEDEVQEKIAADRLHLHLDETCLGDEPPDLGDIVNRIKARPCHVAAIFDESTIRLRQRGAGRNLPMSPFCIRYDVQLLGSGVLDVIRKQDGQPDQKKIIGFAGLLFAARDLQRRYPGALVLSVDHPLARLWLRTGKRALEDRCDLLVLWKDETAGTFHLIAVEVKASNSDQIETARLTHALEQIGNTLEAVADGLAAASLQSRSPLSIPRCEMLKQTLARAAQARSGDGALDRTNLLHWGGWLVELFATEAGKTLRVQLSGYVVSVLLRREAAGITESFKSALQWPVTHRILGLPEVDELLNWEPSAPVAVTPHLVSSGDAANTSETSSSSSAAPHPTPPPEVLSTRLPAPPPVPVPDRVPTTVQSTASSNPTTEHIWPPPVNALGMIGQYQAVDLLVKQALFSKATGQRFSDKLLVGPAGVGKSTLARNIGALLLNREPLFFSGSDLRRPGDLLERLAQEGLVPAAPGTGTVQVEPCLIFIDEVHGISAAVATALLSALDDRRITSIEGGLYDFNQAVFLLATTDQGKLSEAFQSRPNKTWLRSYTLHELAGIVWLRGKECLDGAELSREACYEIAARARCNPRRSVRDLSEALRPHFFHCAGQQMDATPSLQQAAALMTPENIAVFYESQGIDYNGLDDVARRFLHYLKQHGAVSEATLSQALGLTHRQDFVEAAEYLVRLGLIETSPAGRNLTREGRQYLSASPPPDLRHRISRAM